MTRSFKSLFQGPLPALKWFIFVKLLECSWLIYINCRQNKVMVEMERVPENVSQFYSQSEVLKSKIMAIKRIKCDVITIIVDAAVIIVGSMRRRVYHLWLACDLIDEGNEYTSSLVFTMMVVTIYWIARSIPVSLFHKFIVHKEPFHLQGLFIWWLESVYKYVLLVNDYLIVTATLSLLMSLVPRRDYGLSLVVCLYHLGAYAYAVGNMDSGRGAYWAMPESKLKLRLSVIASVLGFRPQQIFNIDRWLEDWRPQVDFDPTPENQMTSLIVTYYREESGGGHAKSFDIPEIMAFAAHGLAMYKMMYPLAMTSLMAMKRVIKLLISLKMISCGVMSHDLGLSPNIPLPVSLFICYFILLSPFETVWRYIELWISRRLHVSSDQVVISLGLGKNLAKSLLKMDAKAGIPPVMDPLYSAFYTTTPLASRRSILLMAAL